MSPKEFIDSISCIVGNDISDGEIDLHYSWDNFEQAKGLLQRIRTVQKELRLLKQQVTATIYAARSEFITARTTSWQEHWRLYWFRSRATSLLRGAIE
jgi:hypothetical protein